MPRQKKELTDKELSKIREVEAYEHKAHERANNPKAGYARYDRVHEETTKYAYDPHIDPTLQWAGKQEGMNFEVQTSSIHIHEIINPNHILDKILRVSRTDPQSADVYQTALFETKLEEMQRKQRELSFYDHGVNWANRLIAGDSLIIMNSLLKKEGMAGSVQMAYFDPPYGIKYGSNFQPFVNDTSLKSTDKDADLSQEPETITAFRDTWELGIHSYLSYIRDRLLLTRELLHESGSVFIQISEENLHHVREICDEVFGANNLVTQITVKKGSTIFAKRLLNSAVYYIVWYAKNIDKIKYHNLFVPKDYQGFADTVGSHLWSENPVTGETIQPTPNERKDIVKFLLKHPGFELYRLSSLNAQGLEKTEGYEFHGKTFNPPQGSQWKTSYPDGLDRLAKANRLQIEGEYLSGKIYYKDYPIMTLTNLWDKVGSPNNKVYVVQTTRELPKRCMLMTTDPGDLVLDITCGSGTTAFEAEEWGRRWITCDTSRVAIDIAKQRLMTATFNYFKLAYPEHGVNSGFVYKTAPHITLGSITNNEVSQAEILYDQPQIETRKVRVTGPFTVESLPATKVQSPDVGDAGVNNDMTAKQDEYRDEIQATGIIGKNGEKLEFSRVEAAQGTEYIQAVAETKEDTPRRAVIHFGSETKVLDAGRVEDIFDEVQQMRPTPEVIIVAAYQFEPEANKLIEETKWPDLQILAVQMNTDLMTGDLKKKRASNQSFFFIGQPDVELIHDKRTKDVYKVQVNGFDYYDPKTGKVKAGGVNNIAMWMLDEGYDGSCIKPEQVFFPLGGKKGGWHKLAKTLHAELDQDAIKQYAGNISLPFKLKPGKKIAVKIIDDRGIESMKVLKVGENHG